MKPRLVLQEPGVNESDMRRMFDVIDRQISLLLRFSEDTLDVSRVRWDAMLLVPASIALEPLVAQVTGSLFSARASGFPCRQLERESFNDGMHAEMPALPDANQYFYQRPFVSRKRRNQSAQSSNLATRVIE